MIYFFIKFIVENHFQPLNYFYLKISFHRESEAGEALPNWPLSIIIFSLLHRQSAESRLASTSDTWCIGLPMEAGPCLQLVIWMHSASTITDHSEASHPNLQSWTHAEAELITQTWVTLLQCCQAWQMYEAEKLEANIYGPMFSFPFVKCAR